MRNTLSFVMSKWRWVIGVYIVVGVIMGYFALHISVDPDLTKVLDPTDPVVEKYLKFQKYAIGEDNLVIVIKVGNNLDDAMRKAFKLVDKLKQADFVKQVLTTDAPEVLRFYGLFFMSSSQLDEISWNVDRALKAVRSLNPFDFNTIRLFGYALYFLDKMRSVLENGERSNRGYIMVSPDNELIVVTITPKGQITNMENVQKVVHSTSKLVADIFGEGYEWGLTGSYASSYDGQKQIYRDFFVTSFISLCAIMLLFLFTYGSVYLTGIIFLAMILAMAITLGVASLIFKSLNMVTTFVNAITLGLGIDFAIHILTHIHEEYLRKRDLGYAIKHGMKTVLKPLAIGAFTTVVVFLTFLAVESPALRELGIISAIGMMVFFTVMTTFLPTILLAFRSSFQKHMKMGTGGKVYYLLSRTIPRGARPLILIALVMLTVLSYFGIKNYMDFSYTPPGFSSSSAPFVKYANLISKHFGGDILNEVPVLVGSLRELPDIVENLKKLETVWDVSSIYDLVGGQLEASSLEKAKTLYRILGENLRNPFISIIMKKYGIFEDVLNAVAASMRSNSPVDVMKEILDNLPSSYRRLFVYEEGSKLKYILRIKPSISLYTNNGVKRFIEEVRTQNVEIVGYPLLMYHATNEIRSSLISIILLSAALVYTIIAFGTREMVPSIFMILMLAAIILSNFGIMKLLDIDVTFINVLAAPLIIGIGVDGMVHVWYASKHGSHVHIARTFKAITTSALTTGIAFISLMASQGKILKDFGISMASGIFLAWSVAIMVIYAIFGGRSR